MEYKIFATDTTAEFLRHHKIKCKEVRKAHEEKPNVIDILEKKIISFVVNLSKTEDTFGQIMSDGFRIRRTAVDSQIPLFTDLHLARAFIKALHRYKLEDLEIKSYKEYLLE